MRQRGDRDSSSSSRPGSPERFVVSCRSYRYRSNKSITGKNTTRGARARTRVVTRITQTNLTTVSTHQRTHPHDSTTTETAADSTAAAPEPTAPRGRLRSLFTGAHGRTRAHGSHRQTSQPSQPTNAPTRTTARRPHDDRYTGSFPGSCKLGCVSPCAGIGRGRSHL